MDEHDQYDSLGLDDSVEDERGFDQIMADCRAAEVELDTRDAQASRRKLPELLHNQEAEGANAGVILKFFIASMCMWVVPLAILYGFNHNLFPGLNDMSPYSMTLLSGFLAVISVNVVIALYICMAMGEPSDKHKPDPKFLADAKTSLNQSEQNETESSSECHTKQE